ncbi:hypothetical protein OE88DRAFT_1648273 [Heliocybe sulcata]|uniref:Uncharacterized protein n=1 Tax=Heliocybe sulcata TaxID=5364 RepID=A0A5C3MZ40_9AGAM|nr:hypothetical protein OE88DRAFT_1648273 [Heliocybe sulcata]
MTHNFFLSGTLVILNLQIKMKSSLQQQTKQIILAGWIGLFGWIYRSRATSSCRVGSMSTTCTAQHTLSTVKFIYLAFTFNDNLYGIYKELQKYATRINDGNFVDTDDEAEWSNEQKWEDNWLGLFEELAIYDPLLYDDGTHTEQEERSTDEEIWELADEDGDKEDEEDEEEEEGVLGWYLECF